MGVNIPLECHGASFGARYQIVPGTRSCQVPDRARYLIVNTQGLHASNYLQYAATNPALLSVEHAKLQQDGMTLKDCIRSNSPPMPALTNWVPPNPLPR
jgi:hypothetical protein